jgi:hypothetical protein
VKRDKPRQKRQIVQAELATQKVLWARAKMKWEEKCQVLIASGILKEAVDGPPPLCDIHPDDSIATLTALSNSTEIVHDSQKGKDRQHSPSIDSLMGEEIDLGASESDEDSEAWSAHNESDE